MNNMEQLRSRLIRSTCEHCKGARHLPGLQNLTAVVGIGVTFLVLGFGFSTFTMFGDGEEAFAGGISLTAVASMIIGLTLASILLRVVCAALDIKLCLCRR